jgi:hypothetical protein
MASRARNSVHSLCDRTMALWEALPELLGEVDEPALEALDWDWQRAETVALLRRLDGGDHDYSISKGVLEDAETAIRQRLEEYPALRDHAEMLAIMFKAECMLGSLAPRGAVED